MPYLYVPFSSSENNSELLSLASQWVDNTKKDPRGKDFKLFFYNPKANKPLQNVPANESVYVLAHGVMGTNDYVSPTSAGGGFLYDHNFIATRLKVSGLPTNHTTVKLYICNCNGGFGNFAARFKQTMNNMGYNAIDVYYYGTSVGIPKLWSDGQYHKEGVLFDSITGNLILTPRFRASEVKVRVP